MKEYNLTTVTIAERKTEVKSRGVNVFVTKLIHYILLFF